MKKVCLGFFLSKEGLLNMILVRGLILLFIFLPSLIFYSCSSTKHQKKEPSQYQDLVLKEVVTSKQIKVMNENLLMQALSIRKDAYRDYRIGPEDLLEISVFEDEKLSKTVRVSSQGNISLPLLGILRVKGLTPYELEKEIRDLLAEKYIQNPNVSVFVKEYRSQRISVIGAVEKPGIFDIYGERTLLDALAMAGGLKEEAGPQLFLIRTNQGDGSLSEKKEPQGPRTIIIDLEQLLIKGDLSLNLPLVHGDVLNIPISGKVYVGGEVRRPGGFHLKGKRMTVSQAVAMAEGLRPEANASQVTIFRYTSEGGERISIPVDLSAIQRGQADDIFLQENDIVIIPKSGIKNFLIEFRDTLKGIIGFGFSLGSL